MPPFPHCFPRLNKLNSFNFHYRSCFLYSFPSCYSPLDAFQMVYYFFFFKVWWSGLHTSGQLTLHLCQMVQTGDLPFDKCVSRFPLKQLVFPFHEITQFLITKTNFEMWEFPHTMGVISSVWYCNIWRCSRSWNALYLGVLESTQSKYLYGELFTCRLHIVLWAEFLH